MLLALPHGTCSWFNYQILMVKYPSPVNLPLVDGWMPMFWRLDFIFWWLNQYTNPYFADESVKFQILDHGSWHPSPTNMFFARFLRHHTAPLRPGPGRSSFCGPKLGRMGTRRGSGTSMVSPSSNWRRYLGWMLLGMRLDGWWAKMVI